MNSITGMEFSTYTNHQTPGENPVQKQTPEVTNTRFGEALNKAISTLSSAKQKQPDPGTQEQYSNQQTRYPVPRTREVSINGEKQQQVIIEDHQFFDINGEQHDTRAVFKAFPPWFTQYMIYTDTDLLDYRADTYPKLKDIPETERYHLSQILWEVLDDTLAEFSMTRGSMEFVNAVFEDSVSSQQIHLKFWDNLLLDDRMEKYIKRYYV